MQSQHSQKGHILKFVHSGRTFSSNVGIKAFPKQTYGVSPQSPQQFKQKHTLLADNGYFYKYENKKQFQYPSQTNCFSINNCNIKDRSAQMPQQLGHNSMAFHRKKGRLSQFMDKNGWMSSVVPIMGFQRTEDARGLSNKDRKTKISRIRPKAKYQNKAAKKPIINQDYFNTISMLMSQKLKIRKRRQDFIEAQGIATARPSFNSHSLLKSVHQQLVEQSLEKTTKQLYTTNSTFFNSRALSKQRAMQIKSSYSSRAMNKEAVRLNSAAIKRNSSAASQVNFRSSPSKNSMKNINESDIISPQEMKLQQWQRTNCHSKKNLNEDSLNFSLER